ncbi:DinB family protein [Pedobacter panaciterrae]|uniref:DinB family protein n=1 Tax=Pedobacter panaciterrae TaxID=363849 RepID=A0ABU8NQW4_9SPHI
MTSILAKELLRQQYVLVKSSRTVVLDFLETQLKEEVFSPLDQFNGFSPGKMLLHIAGVYCHWIGNFSLKLNIDTYQDYNVSSFRVLRTLFEEADSLILTYIDEFGNNPNQVISGIISGKKMEATTLEVFTHVLTHEFHHKGQIMIMCRLLGHTPPDTDIIRF